MNPPEQSVSEILEQLRGLLPDVNAALALAQDLPDPVDPVVEAYLRDHLGFWRPELVMGLDVGSKRSRQEDGVYLNDAARVFMVIDGMGGQGSGELATPLITDALNTVFQRATLLGDRFDSAATCPLVAGLEAGNKLIFDHPFTLGASVAGIFVDGKCMNLVHVGDCRAYQWRGGALSLLTRDHSLVNEMPDLSPEQKIQFRNVVSRSVGYKDEIECGWARHAIEPGDVLLLCTDGLWDVLPFNTLADLLATAETWPLSSVAKALHDAALETEAPDNIGFVLIRF